MAEFVFDPPRRLKREATVRTVGEAADFARDYVGSRFPRRREGVLHQLEAAMGYEKQRDAGRAFLLWAKAESLLEE
jgi:hypothetical protein